MFRRELKINFKSFCIWTIITIILFLIVFLVYPSIKSSSPMGSLNEMMEMYPKELLKAFNMDLASIDTAYGWLKSEGFVFILLIIGCYSAILGSNILLKEESDGTIEYLGTLPIKRISIVISKALAAIIYITLLTVIIGVFNYVGLKLSETFDEKQYILLSITPLFSSYLIFFICLFLSTFTRKTKNTIGISLGIVLVSYVLNTLSFLSEKVEFLKYFSAFTLSDIRNVMTNITINPIMVIICLISSAALLFLTVIKYNRKEFV